MSNKIKAVKIAITYDNGYVQELECDNAQWTLTKGIDVIYKEFGSVPIEYKDNG